MNKKLLAAAVTAALVSPSAFAEGHEGGLTTSHLSASFRVGLVLNDAAESDFRLQNLGSRLKWSGSKDLENGLTAFSYIELGLNPDQNAGGSNRSGGIDRTRHLWAGLKGGFGSVKVGAQYAAFYDMVQGHTDIAWWGSCFQQFECGRETNIIKYSGSSGGISYALSAELEPGDDDNDALDEVELGVNFAAGPLTLGVGASIHAGNGGSDGGTLIGGVAKGKFGGLGLGLGFQVADEDFAGGVDDVTNVTLTGTFGKFYAVFNAQGNGDNGEDGNFATLGYTLNIGPSTLMYFEAQSLDNGGPETTTFLRATFKYDFDAAG